MSATLAEGQWSLQPSGTTVEFRGLSDANSAVVWPMDAAVLMPARCGGRAWNADTST
jgi:hypothetical protein